MYYMTPFTNYSHTKRFETKGVSPKRMLSFLINVFPDCWSF